MIRGRDRRCAAALQRALEDHERLVARGRSADDAAAEVGRRLTGPEGRVFALAAGLKAAGSRAALEPDPSFAARLSQRLRTAEAVRRPAVRPARPRFGLAPLAAAACVAVLAALLVPAMRSLPGDRLYGLKGLSEDARLLFATGATEARVRLDLAEERFSEIERLIERSRIRALAGVYAAPLVEGVTDPALARLVESALHEAGAHLEAAADILTTNPTEATDLDELVEVSQRGHALATKIADDLPNREQPPVLTTVVKLAKIEAAAKAARTKARRTAEPTPPPCATPSADPSPAASPSPSPTVIPTPTPTDAAADAGVDPSATPTAVESPDASPGSVPEETPCLSPSPSPTPTPTPADPSADPSVTPVREGVEGAEGGEGGEVSDPSKADQAAPKEPADA